MREGQLKSDHLRNKENANDREDHTREHEDIAHDDESGDKIEGREEEPTLSPETQAQIVFEILIGDIKKRGKIKGDDFSKEVIMRAESFIELGANFDRDGIALIKKICSDVQPELNGVELRFPENPRAIGSWDGKTIAIAPDIILQIAHSRQSGIVYLRAVRAHEDYHKNNRHEEGFKTGSTATSKALVRIGGLEFTAQELVEAINIIDVPVPTEREPKLYREYANKLLRAVRMSKEVESISDVRRAINETKDLSKIEDTE